MGDIHDEITGHEIRILNAMGIDPPQGFKTIRCPYPDHEDRNPSWRWDWRRKKAVCSCTNRYHSIFDVIIKMGIAPDFAGSCKWIRAQLGGG